MPQKCIEGSCRKRPLSVETVRKYVAENPLTEPEGLLLRGSAAMRGFAGCLDHNLEWLERFSPGGGARFRGATLKRWRRNTAAVRAWPRCRHVHGDGLQMRCADDERLQRACGFIPSRRPDCAGPMHCARSADSNSLRDHRTNSGAGPQANTAGSGAATTQ